MSGNAYLETALADSSSRGQSRRRLHLETSGTLISGERANVTVHNVSATGFLIETDVGLSINEAVTVDLPQTGPVVARVAWASSHLFGCQFDQQISASVLSAMQLKGGPPLDDGANVPAGLRQSSSATMGKQLEQLRKKRGMTLADVAGQLGVSKPTVWAWEKGKARPVESRLPDIAKALDISEQELAAMAIPPAVNDLLDTSKRKIADAFGTGPEKVRIMIEL
ncbi:helix-turn-helix domain-containing protein [Parasphingorhabdus sp.]|uniref:helix-turn-helix domain-containing protein n=1 Tax=Parasphingorhabdus sp. TaxID=2709688 RepID=UPI00329755F2